MLNPYLEQRLFSLPVQPVLVEIDPAQFAATLGQITGLKLPIVSNLPPYGFAAIAPISPSVIKKINSLPGVRMVHANQVKTIFQIPVPADEWFSTSESRKMLGAEDAFREGFNGEAIKVGVTDTGIDATHPQLQGTEFYSVISWPFREVLDENGHGSHCASTVGGKLYRTPLDVPVEGVSHAPMVSVKCLGRGVGTGFTSEIINAMATCYDKGAQIISMSLGSAECQGGCEICPECRMVSSLTARGIIFVIAAGNCLTKSAWILTSSGYQPVHQIKQGDKLINLNPITGTFEEDEVEGVYKRWTRRSKKFGPIEEIFTITTDDGYVLDLTEDHPVLVEGRGWVAAKALEVGMHLLSYPLTEERYKKPRKCGFGGMSPRKHMAIVKKAILKARQVAEARKVTLTCPQCNTKFKVWPCLEDERTYCSLTCANIAQQGQSHSPDTQFNNGLIPWNKDLKAGNDPRVAKISQAGAEALRIFKKDKPEEAYDASVRGAQTVLQKFSRGKYVSAAERILIHELTKAGISQFQAQSLLKLGPRWSCIPDLLFEEQKIAVFVDGRFFHSREEVAIRDARIDGRLREMGYMTLRFQSEKVKRHPDKYVNYLKELVAAKPVDPIIIAISRRKRRSEVWDIATKKNHTIVANGLVIHNSGPQENSIGCPGCNPDAITVAAVDRNREVASFSSRGGDRFPLKPDVAAPGVDIYSGTARGSFIDVQEAAAGMGFAAISGTSMATPHVAGFMALLKQKFPQMTAAQFKQTMAQRGHSKDYQTGWGIPHWSYFK